MRRVFGREEGGETGVEESKEGVEEKEVDEVPDPQGSDQELWGRRDGRRDRGPHGLGEVSET